MAPPPERDQGREARRIDAVHGHDILGTPPDGASNGIAAPAAHLFGAPPATVTVVDTDRVCSKAAYGLGGVTQAVGVAFPGSSAVLTDVLGSRTRRDGREA